MQRKITEVESTTTKPPRTLMDLMKSVVSMKADLCSNNSNSSAQNGWKLSDKTCSLLSSQTVDQSAAETPALFTFPTQSQTSNPRHCLQSVTDMYVGFLSVCRTDKKTEPSLSKKFCQNLHTSFFAESTRCLQETASAENDAQLARNVGAASK
jgi:hypothetical protein